MRMWLGAASALTSLLLVGCGGSRPAPEDVAGSPSDSYGTGIEPRWTQLPDAPLGPRYRATTAWAGGSLLVFGGRDTDPCPPGADCALPDEPPLRDGARFHPDSQTWSPLAPLPVDVEYASTAVVDGTVYLWGHARDGQGWNTAFLAYDVGADRWEQLPLPDVTELRGYELEAGDGEILLAVGSHENGYQADLRYEPAQQRFIELPPDPLVPSFDRDLSLVGDLLVVTGIPVTPSPGGADGPARYRAAFWTAEDGWRELPPGDVIGHNPEWFPVDGQLVNPAPGGSDGGQTNPYDRIYPFGGRLDPVTGEWSYLPDAPDVDPDGLRLGGLGDDQLLLSGTGLALQPRAGRWIELDVPDDVPEQGVSGAVGEGRVYLFGGVHWESGTDYRLSAGSWVFTPPSEAAEPSR